MSNTSKGRGVKGSKFWMQTLIEINNGNTLAKEIQKKGWRNRRNYLDFTIEGRGVCRI